MPSPRGSERPRTGRVRGVLGLLVACVGAAAAATVALDAYLAEQRRFVPLPVDRSMLRPPEVGIWSAAPLLPGSPAPAFRLPDVRTGAVVGLDDYRGRPVVLLLGSYG